MGSFYMWYMSHWGEDRQYGGRWGMKQKAEQARSPGWGVENRVPIQQGKGTQVALREAKLWLKELAPVSVVQRDAGK